MFLTHSCSMPIDSAVDDLKADDSLLEPFRERLMKLVDDIGEEEVRRLCDHALRRLLVARVLNNLDKAYSMGVEILRWRTQIKPSELTISDFVTVNSQAVWIFAGYAKNNWPIILIKANRWDPAKYSVDEYVKMVTFFLERNEKRMNPDDPEAKNYIMNASSVCGLPLSFYDNAIPFRENSPPEARETDLLA